MRRRILWAGLAALVGGAVVVRLLYRPPEDAHERMHAEEAQAQATIDSLAQLPPQQQLRELERYLALQSPIAVRTAAVEAIARIDAPEARALLRESLRDFASPVRTRVAEMATRQPRETPSNCSSTASPTTIQRCAKPPSTRCSRSATAARWAL